jgi:hypothetical protein
MGYSDRGVSSCHRATCPSILSQSSLPQTPNTSYPSLVIKLAVGHSGCQAGPTFDCYYADLSPDGTQLISSEGAIATVRELQFWSSYSSIPNN